MGKARDLLGEDIQTEEQLMNALIRKPQCDAEITRFVAESGYCDYWKEDMLRNPWRYDVAVFRSIDDAHDKKVQAAVREKESATEQMAQFMYMKGVYLSVWKIRPLSYVAQQISLYSNLVTWAQTRLDVADQFLAAKGDAP